MSQNVTECAVTGKIYCTVFGPHLTTSLNHRLSDILTTSLLRRQGKKTLSTNVTCTFIFYKLIHNKKMHFVLTMKC